MGGYYEALKKYKVFSGRARRQEFWSFILVNSLIYAVLYALDKAIGPFAFLPVTLNGVQYAGMGLGLCSGLYALAAMPPLLSAAVRRMHDTGRSGRALLIGLIPVAGTLVVLYFLAQNGQAGENRYDAPSGPAGALPAAPPAPANS